MKTILFRAAGLCLAVLAVCGAGELKKAQAAAGAVRAGEDVSLNSAAHGCGCGCAACAGAGAED